MKPLALVIHGGAGTLVKGLMTPEKELEYQSALDIALQSGYQILESGGSAMDAIEEAVKQLENSTLFNAGRGSVFTHKGTHEMDASIMCGQTLSAGSVSLITGIKNPISLARDVMEHSEHVFLAAEGAMEFAISRGYKIEEPSYFYDSYRYQQWQEIKDSDHFQLDHSDQKDRKFGTVGAVACDSNGNVAAATSTGGMTNKRWGRIGDSPIIGAGNYANNHTCAVSCTGSGEFFIRGVAAYDVSCLIEYKGYNLEQAANEVIMNRMVRIGGDGGLIAVNTKGEIAMPFNTEGMYRASQVSNAQTGFQKKKKILIYGDSEKI